MKVEATWRSFPTQSGTQFPSSHMRHRVWASLTVWWGPVSVLDTDGTDRCQEGGGSCCSTGLNHASAPLGSPCVRGRQGPGGCPSALALTENGLHAGLWLSSAGPACDVAWSPQRGRYPCLPHSKTLHPSIPLPSSIGPAAPLASIRWGGCSS